jgi:hypothetical protein
MPNELDITPLRSLIAVADTGGWSGCSAGRSSSRTGGGHG